MIFEKFARPKTMFFLMQTQTVFLLSKMENLLSMKHFATKCGDMQNLTGTWPSR